MVEQPNDKQLKCIQIIEDLKNLIFSGQVQAGEKMPSENILSRQYQVSRQTVRKAIAILEHAGYVYVEHGRGTFCSELIKHSKNSKNIAVVTTYLSDYIFPYVIKGIDSVLSAHGYSIMLKNTKNSRTNEVKCLEELLQKDIDGMIIEPSKSQIYCRHRNLYQKLDQYQIPYVFIQGCYSQMSEKPQVIMDDCKGGYLITKYLLSLGHTKIAGVFKADDTQGLNRHKGYVMALQEAGILYDTDLVVWFHTEDRMIHPYERIRQMVDQKIEIHAVVCYNDQIAVQAVKALKDSGLRVPEDVSVTGYDNSYIANSGGMRLTTIAHPQEQLGQMAAQLLLEIIQNGEQEVKKKKILIEPELVRGNSCSRRIKHKEKVQ